MKIRTKYLRLDQYGLFIWRYRITKSNDVVSSPKIKNGYKEIKLPFGYRIYYLLN